MGQWLRALMSTHGVKLQALFQLFDPGRCFLHPPPAPQAQCPYLLNVEITNPVSMDSCENENWDDSSIVLKHHAREITRDPQIVVGLETVSLKHVCTFT